MCVCVCVFVFLHLCNSLIVVFLFVASIVLVAVVLCVCVFAVPYARARDRIHARERNAAPHLRAASALRRPACLPARRSAKPRRRGTDATVHVCPISLLRISLLRLLDSGFPGNSLWTWEFHPLLLRFCLSQTL